MIEVPLYGGKVELIKSTDDFEKISVEFTQEFSGTLDDHRGVVHLDFEGTPIYYVGVFDGKLSTLVHELSHVAIMIVERAGFNPQDGNGEPFCYLVDYLFDTFAREFG